MKNTNIRRLLSLLLAVVMALSLAPTALLADEEGDDTQDPPATEQPGGSDDSSDDNTTTDPEPQPTITGLTIGGDDYSRLTTSTHGCDYDLILEPGAVNRGTVRLSADVEPSNSAANQEHRVVWSSKDESVVGVQELSDSSHPGPGHIGSITSRSTGETIVTITVEGTSHSKTIHVEVSGIKLSDELAKGVTLNENESRTFTKDKDYFLFGSLNKDNADVKLAVTAQTGQRNVTIRDAISKSAFTVEGRLKGAARLRMEASAGGLMYAEEFTVNVEATELRIPYTDGCSPERPLKFSALESLINQECVKLMGTQLESVIDLQVSSAQGILYLGYKSPNDTGAGVGSSVTYYATGKSARGPFLSDITFVPNSRYKGEKAEIRFTGQTTGSDGQPRTFKGVIEVTLSDEKADLTVSTRRETPLKLTASMFSTACQAAVGSPLNYVIFTLPPASQGTLYVDYKSEHDYATTVSATAQYNQNQLNTITFVPAPGYVGEVRISYAGYSVTGSKYSGELVILVQQGLDDEITYNDNGAGSVTFSGADFDDFCYNVTGRGLGTISFTPPPASQGVLYSTISGARGSEVTIGDSFGETALNRVTFYAADGFQGIVRIGFTGTYRGSPNSKDFEGTVEIHIQSAGNTTTSRGDINYICAAGQSVKLALGDFTNLCQTLTGQRLHYIQFQNLPDFNQGALYHNRTSAGGMGTRVTTATKYYNSATPYLANLSFWATDSFRDGVEIPFTGSAVNGQTFTAILYIGTGAGSGSGAASTVSYTVTGQNPARFVGSDFDNACRLATGEALSYVRFSLPTSGQGILYYDYRSETNPTALDTSRNLYLNGEERVERVAFVPASGFAGVVTVPFTGWSIKGQQFQGNVQITVYSAAAMGGLVRYETTGAPVHINAYNIQEAAGGVPVSVRLTGLPTADQGKLYYQYVSPTRYSWQGNTSTVYSLYGDPAVSNLTFIPKAGYYGEVSIPYSATNQDGSTSNGTIRITVSQPQVSANFNDLAGYSAQTKSAVDYLYAQGVVNGVGEGKYEPGASIRRGDFCLMLARAFQFNVGSTATGFTDVSSTAYYAQAVNQLYALGIVNGVGGGKFNPSAPVSRQDAALMVQRTLNQAGISAPDGNAAALAAYADRGEVSGYAQGAVGGLAQQGLLPLTNGRLVPKANLTRADMAVLLHRAMAQ